MDFGTLFAEIIKFVGSWGMKFLVALAVLAIGMKLTNMLANWIRTSRRCERLDISLRSFLASFSKVALYILVFITAAMIVGIPTASFLTVLASCGVTVGLALQGSLSNFAGGLMLLFFKPFKVGDYIETVQAAGTVEEISVVYTVVLTPDHKRVTIPNGTLTNGVMKNHSAEEIRRADMTIRAAAGCDTALVQAAILRVVGENPMALADPAPFVRILGANDATVLFGVRVFCKSADYAAMQYDLVEAIHKAVDEATPGLARPAMEINIDR